MGSFAIGPRPTLPSAMMHRLNPPVSASLPPSKDTPAAEDSSSSKNIADQNFRASVPAGSALNKSSNKTSKAPERLTDAELKLVQELQQRDAQVRVHEQAHMAAAGGYAIGGPSYDYQSGPDGRSYAVGGHVKLDTSTESTPEATIQKAETLRRAALAPADPSGADRSVAAAATKMEQSARKEQIAEAQEKREGSKGTLQGIGKYNEIKDIVNNKHAKGEQINQQI